MTDEPDIQIFYSSDEYEALEGTLEDLRFLLKASRENSERLATERDKLLLSIAELGASLDRMMQDNSELEVKVHRLEAENARLKRGMNENKKM